MKKWTLLALAGVATAQAQLPFETEAHRKPKLQTNGTVLIKNASLLTVTQQGRLDNADLLIVNGKIAAVGKNVTPPAGALVIDGTGKVVSPGIVDAHIHRGSDATNEGTDSITAEVRIEDVLNPYNRNVWQAVAGGETTGLILHGSANAIGGQSFVAKLKYGRPPEQMRIPDAPRMIKFALGENVTRSGSTTSSRFPRTRMGVQALYRRSFTEARAYMKAWDAWEKSDKSGKAPRRDLRLETLADILRGKIWVQCHSYRADEMLMMVRMSQEFGFKIGALQHGLEAYKIAPELAKAGVGVSIFVDNWSFKIEGYDGIPYNAAICTNAGVNVSINTDGTSGVPAIAIDAAKTMRYGGMTEAQALAMVTMNPARSLGIDHRVGSLEVGKDGDVVIWDGHPLSVYSRVNTTLIDGEVFFQRRDAHGVDKDSTLKTVLTKNQRREPLRIAEGKSTYVVRGATLHPISRAPFSGEIRVENGRITEVGPRVNSRGAEVVNAGGLNLYPGFIDAGNAIGLNEISGIGQMVDQSELGSSQPDLIAASALQVQSEHFPVARQGGVLISLTRPSGGTISGQASVISNGGWTWEQMRLGQEMLTVTFQGAAPRPADACCMDMGGGPDDHDHDHADEPMGGAAATLAAVQSAGDLEQFITRVRDYASKSAGNPQTAVEVGLEAAIPYAEGKKPILLRVRGAASIRAAVATAKKLGLKIVLSGALDAWKETELLAKEKIPVLINPAGRSTLFANAPANEWDPYDTTFALPALLVRGGVKFAFQSDDNSGAFNLPVRVGQSCAYGLSPERALRALTLDAAEILGVDKEVGSLDPGKRATFFLSDGDPLDLTTNVVGVFVDGRPMAIESRFTRLRDQWSKRAD